MRREGDEKKRKEDGQKPESLILEMANDQKWTGNQAILISLIPHPSLRVSKVAGFVKNARFVRDRRFLTSIGFRHLDKREDLCKTSRKTYP